MSYRVGTGFDAHRLVEGRALVLGGSRSSTTGGSKVTPTPMSSATR